MTSSIPPTSIVIDSNVWISALVFGGNPRKVFEAILQRGDYLIVSSELLNEIRRTLHRKFPYSLDDFEALLIAVSHLVITVTLGSLTITVCRDPDDNKILETAVLGQSAYLISGDNDLLTLHPYESIQNIRPQAWLALL